MAVQESRSIGRSVGAFLGVAFTITGLAVLLAIGYILWPSVQARYQGTPQPTKAAVDTSEADRLRAQNAAIQAQLDAVRAAQQPVIVQEVPAGQAPQTTTVNTPPVDNGTVVSDPPPAPIIIVHQVDNSGHQTVTGSGACAAAAKGARRCGDK